MPRKLQEGETPASEAILKELEKPLKERDAQKIVNTSEAVSLGNLLNWVFNRDAKKAGIVTSDKEAEPVVDEKGNITGFRVKK